MGAVKDTVTWATYATRIRYMCEVKGSGQDTRLQRVLAVATTVAEAYLANPFDGCDALSPSTVPDDVIEGVLRYVQVMWTSSGGGRSGDAGTLAGTLAISDTRIAYSALGGGFNPSKAPLQAALPCWSSWRRKVWR